MNNEGACPLQQEVPKGYVPRFIEPELVRQPSPEPEPRHKWPGSATDAMVANNPLYARDILLKGVLQSYILESRQETEAFLRVRPTAIGLFTEAVPHIDEAFGTERMKLIRLLHDDYEGTSLVGVVLWPGSVDSGMEALERFDRRWWLRNCTRANGSVNFNFELV